MELGGKTAREEQSLMLLNIYHAIVIYKNLNFIHEKISMKITLKRNKTKMIFATPPFI